VNATFVWIVGSGLAMSAIALIGSVTLLLSAHALKCLLLPLVAFAAGSLLGGAFFHMLPVGLAAGMSDMQLYALVLAGFTVFFGLEQFLHWHHCHRSVAASRKPLTYLILIGDGLHNFLGGIAVAGTFLIDVRLGIITWLAAAAHEVPQELGDFAVLVHGGWSRNEALFYNLASALTFLVGGVVAYFASSHIDVSFLVPFAAGNFIYIGASDLIPEVRTHTDATSNAIHFAAYAAGIALMLAVKLTLEA
jgi:zinc and cadmium transporter